MSVIDIRTSAREPIEIPLASDPALRAVNPEASILDLLLTSHAEGLVVPPDASIACIRPLSKPVEVECNRAAGRQPMRGQQAYAAVLHRVGERYDRERLSDRLAALKAAREKSDARVALGGAISDLAGVVREAMAADAPVVALASLETAAHVMVAAQGQADAIGALEARRAAIVAEELDRLTDDEHAARLTFLDWSRRRGVEIVRRCLLWISTGAAPDAPRLTAEQALAQLDPDAVEEIAAHATRLSTLGPTRPQSSATSSGPGMASPPSGGAVIASADPTYETSAEPAAASSGGL